MLELYSVPLTGGSTTKLNGTLITGGDVYLWAISPDNSRVVYFANQDVVTRTELYAAPITGGASVKLNGPIVAGGSLIGFQINPDGSGVVYRATQDVPTIIEFYGVAITGGPVSKLNGALTTGRNTTVSTMNNQSVVYAADQDTDNVFELFASDVAFNIGGGFKVYLPVVLR